MSGYGYTSQTIVLKGGSADSSTITSSAAMVADADQISLSVVSVAAVASNWTVQGTNANGFTAAIAEGEWSTVSVIAAQGIFSVTPGMRWIRLQRPAVNSLASVVLSYRVS